MKGRTLKPTGSSCKLILGATAGHCRAWSSRLRSLPPQNGRHGGRTSLQLPTPINDRPSQIGIMRKSKNEAFVQACNAQVTGVADGSQLILGQFFACFVRHFNELLREAELWEPVQRDRGLAGWMIKRPTALFANPTGSQPSLFLIQGTLQGVQLGF